MQSNFVYKRFNGSPLLDIFIFIFLFFSEEKSHLPGFELTSQRVRRFRGYQLSYRGDRLSSKVYAVINVVSTRSKADKGIMDALVNLRKKRGAGGSNCRRVSPGDADLGACFTLTMPGSPRDHPSS